MLCEVFKPTQILHTKTNYTQKKRVQVQVSNLNTKRVWWGCNIRLDAEKASSVLFADRYIFIWQLLAGVVCSLGPSAVGAAGKHWPPPRSINKDSGFIRCGSGWWLMRFRSTIAPRKTDTRCLTLLLFRPRIDGAFRAWFSGTRDYFLFFLVGDGNMEFLGGWDCYFELETLFF